MKDNHQTIRCGIESCVHCRPDHYCDKSEIKITPCAPCDCDSVSVREESMCADFEEKNRSFF